MSDQAKNQEKNQVKIDDLPLRPPTPGEADAIMGGLRTDQAVVVGHQCMTALYQDEE